VHLRGDICYDSWSLSHLCQYPGTTPVITKLDHNRSCPWVLAQVTKAPTIRYRERDIERKTDRERQTEWIDRRKDRVKITLHHTTHTVPRRTTLQHAAPRCNTLQHTATHYNTRKVRNTPQRHPIGKPTRRHVHHTDTFFTRVCGKTD